MTAGLTFAVLTFGVGPSLALELTGLLIGWCAAVASLGRLVLHRGSSISALTLSAALAGAPLGAVGILGMLSDLADPGISSVQAGLGIPLFFFGLLVVLCGAAIDLIAPAAPGAPRAVPA
jgi:hypothetical protein